MLNKKFKNLKSFSVLIIPDSGATGTTSQKLTAARVITLVVTYSLLMFVISAMIIAYTPVRDLFIEESNLSSSDLKKIEILNERMFFLTKELESLKSTNEKLRYAIMLGDSSAIDTLEARKKNDEFKSKTGGNLLAVIRELFWRDDKKDEDNLIYFYPPSKGYISRRFNPERGHFGLDYVLKTGSPVVSAASGYIIFSDYTVKDGFMIIVSHSDEYISVYKHCSALVKREREVVIQGETIALSGNTGEETVGPHLHFEIWKNGQPLDPEKVILNN